MKMRINLIAAILTVSALGGAQLAELEAQQTDETRSVRDGVYTQEQLERGRATFDEECSFCHGYELEGGEEAPALTGGAFLSDWNGLTLGELSDRIRTTMPPDKPRSLSRQQISDILSLILGENRFPAGESELASRPRILRRIKIDSFGP
jgi:mono/diheme cytochrome c family protein